jgi:hypothetical protein
MSDLIARRKQGAKTGCSCKNCWRSGNQNRVSSITSEQGQYARKINQQSDNLCCGRSFRTVWWWWLSVCAAFHQFWLLFFPNEHTKLSSFRNILVWFLWKLLRWLFVLSYMIMTIIQWVCSALCNNNKEGLYFTIFYIIKLVIRTNWHRPVFNQSINQCNVLFMSSNNQIYQTE